MLQSAFRLATLTSDSGSEGVSKSFHYRGSLTPLVLNYRIDIQGYELYLGMVLKTALC